MPTRTVQAIDARLLPARLDLVPQFLHFYKVARDAAPATLIAYEESLKVWGDWWAIHGHEGEVSPEDIVAFKEELTLRYAPETINLRMQALRHFYAWLLLRGFTQVNPTNLIQGSRKRKSTEHKRDRLSNDQVRAVLATCDESPIGIRDRAMISLSLYCALREGEIFRANIGDLRTKSRRLTLKVQRKGHREADATVVIPEHLVALLNTWKYERNKVAGNSPDLPLFVSLGPRTEGQRLSTSAMRRIINNRLAQAGIAVKHGAWHTLRHTCISQLIECGGDLLQAQQLAGHTDPKTTLIYIHETDRLQNAPEDKITYD